MSPSTPRARTLSGWLRRVPYPQLMPLYLAVFVDVLGYSVLIPFLPFFAQEFHASALHVGLLLSANALFGFFSGPIWGGLSDRYGRKPFLLLAQFGTLAGFVILIFARSLTVLFISRIVDGIFGGQFPIVKAVVGDISKPQDRSKEMSNIGVAHILSSLLGPGVGGLLSRWGVAAPAILAAGLTALAMLLTVLYVRESHPVEQRAPASLVRGSGPRPRAGAVLWRNPMARMLLIQWLFHTLSFSLFMSCISLFANLRLELNAEQVGLMLTVAGLVRVVVRFVIFVPLLNRLGDVATSRLGLAVFVLAYALLGVVNNQVLFVVILGLSSFAASCARGPLTGFLSRSVRPNEQGVAMGANVSLDNLAQILGPIVGGAILGGLPAWMYGGLAALLSVVALGMAFKPLSFPFEQAGRPATVASDPELD